MAGFDKMNTFQHEFENFQIIICLLNMGQSMKEAYVSTGIGINFLFPFNFVITDFYTSYIINSNFFNQFLTLNKISTIYFIEFSHSLIFHVGELTPLHKCTFFIKIMLLIIVMLIPFHIIIMV